MDYVFIQSRALALDQILFTNLDTKSIGHLRRTRSDLQTQRINIEFEPDDDICYNDWTALISAVVLAATLNSETSIFTLCPNSFHLLETNSDIPFKAISIKNSKSKEW